MIYGILRKLKIRRSFAITESEDLSYFFTEYLRHGISYPSCCKTVSLDRKRLGDEAVISF
jgi:hypothetical protein